MVKQVSSIDNNPLQNAASAVAHGRVAVGGSFLVPAGKPSVYPTIPGRASTGFWRMTGTGWVGAML